MSFQLNRAATGLLAVLLWFFAALLLQACLVGRAQAAGPIETSVFAVQGVAVDETDTDAATAKNKALVNAQMKAIVMLAQRLGNEQLAADIAKLPEKEVLPLLKSLSIEQESTAPGRYIGTFTVRFLPTKIERLFGGYGINIVTEQSRPIMVVPVWKTPEGMQLWEDNLWRKAWIDQHLEQSLVPIIIPLGDTEDTAALTVEDIQNLDPVKLEALRRRYDVKTVLIATAEPAEGGAVHALIAGSSELGKINIDKVYTSEPPTVEGSAVAAVQRFHQLLEDKYKSDKEKAQALARSQEANTPHIVAVTVPFSGPSEWNGLRSRILQTPGVLGVDVASLELEGATVKLKYSGDLQEVQASIQATGLNMQQEGSGWVIRPLGPNGQ